MFSLQTHAFAKPVILSLVVNSPGTPPHLYYNEKKGDYDGVIPDLLRFAELDGVISVDYVDSHRSRNEVFVANGQFDMFYSSLEWVDDPEKLISTTPIFLHKSYLYSTKPFPPEFALNAETNARICTRRGFVYPSLDVWFKQGNFERIDSSSHESMIDMLMLGRCDAAELNAKNMLAMQKIPRYADVKFYRLEPPTSIVPAVLIMHPSKHKERDILNRYIKQFTDNGMYERSLEKHLKAL